MRTGPSGEEPAEKPRVNVLCIKWGTKYGPEYVNKLGGCSLVLIVIYLNSARVYLYMCMCARRLCCQEVLAWTECDTDATH